MQFLIEIEGDDQPTLIEALDVARQRLMEGGCFLNVTRSGGGSVRLRPANDESEEEFRKQYQKSHPRTKINWVG